MILALRVVHTGAERHAVLVIEEVVLVPRLPEILEGAALAILGNVVPARERRAPSAQLQRLLARKTRSSKQGRAHEA